MTEVPSCTQVPTEVGGVAPAPARVPQAPSPAVEQHTTTAPPALGVCAALDLALTLHVPLLAVTSVPLPPPLLVVHALTLVAPLLALPQALLVVLLSALLRALLVGACASDARARPVLRAASGVESSGCRSSNRTTYRGTRTTRVAVSVVRGSALSVAPSLARRSAAGGASNNAYGSAVPCCCERCP